ncbi:unnamed protein product [Rhodiola kirilowii]
MSAGGGFRVSIPNNMRKTIQNMKEITGNHSDDDIYAMLKECSMDPNEAIHRLLFQDPFHEVKRKRDRKKEVQNPNNKEPASRWTQNAHGRGHRGGRTNDSRHISHDTGFGRSAPLKETTKSQVTNNIESSTQERKFKADAPIQSSNDLSEIMAGDASDIMETEVNVKPPVLHKTDKAWNSKQLSQPDTSDKSSPLAYGSSNVQSKPISTSSNDSASSAVCFSASDPVLVPSDDAWHHSTVGAIKREVGSQRNVDPTETRAYAASEITHTLILEPAKPQGIHKSQANESHSSSSVNLSGSTGSRPSSNYSNRGQQAIGSQKAPNKEWKPKQMNINPSSGTGTPSTAEITVISSEVNAQSQPSVGVINHLDNVSSLEMKFEELHVKERKNVIIPNHIHVPESERFGLSFGSIDADFGVNIRKYSGIGSVSNSASFSKTSHGGEEPVGEQPLSNQNAAANVEENDYDDSPQTQIHVPENISHGNTNTSVVSGASPDFNDTPEIAVPHGEEQYLAVQQPLNPPNYAQFYRSSSDFDGRVSPFSIQGVGPKYNGNSQPSHSQQESGNPPILSTAAPAALVSQAGGVMQVFPQQLLPIFRPPTGMHLSHYPPNYIPYGHYFSPYYLPGPPAIHPFLGNGLFPQQPPLAGNMYPTPTPPTSSTPAAGIKYPFSQYKTAGNSTNIGVPSGYGPYSSSPAPGNPNNNEDIPDSQFKEGNTFITGQQSEASTVWVAGPGPDMSNLPANSFYNLPPHPQGQHISFTPTQPGHGAYANLYHHPGQGVTGAAMHPLLHHQSQTMAAPDMVGSTGNMYQQSPHPQANWLNNY